MAKDENEPKKKSVLKWILGCGGLVVLLGILAVILVSVLVYRSVTRDPGEAKEVADSIVKFELPEGYKMVFANSWLFKMAMFENKDSHDRNLVCFMMRSPSWWGMDREKMESRMDAQARKQAEKEDMRVTDRGTETFDVRGEEVEAAKIKLVSKDGTEYTRYQLLLEDEKGDVMIQLQGASENFDEDAMDSFLDSIE